MKYIVYKLTSPSGKMYIGYTSRSLRQRLNDHKSEAQKNIRKIHKALLKYPIDDWEKEIIFTSHSKDEAVNFERKMIRELNTIETGYNLSEGGEHGALGVKRSEAQKKAHSERMKGRKHTEEWKKNHSEKLMGHPPSELQKQRVSEANAKSYVIIDPDGNKYDIINLRKFCKLHKLSQSNLSYHGKYKGWQLRR